MEENQGNATVQNEVKTKFCKYCGAKIHEDAIICTSCGRQVEELKGAQAQPQVVVNNTNVNKNVNSGRYGSEKNNGWHYYYVYF